MPSEPPPPMSSSDEWRKALRDMQGALEAATRSTDPLVAQAASREWRRTQRRRGTDLKVELKRIASAIKSPITTDAVEAIREAGRVIRGER